MFHQDPLSGVISGTVRVEIAADAADEYTSMSPLEALGMKPRIRWWRTTHKPPLVNG